MVGFLTFCLFFYLSAKDADINLRTALFVIMIIQFIAWLYRPRRKKK